MHTAINVIAVYYYYWLWSDAYWEEDRPQSSWRVPRDYLLEHLIASETVSMRFRYSAYADTFIAMMLAKSKQVLPDAKLSYFKSNIVVFFKLFSICMN